MSKAIRVTTLCIIAILLLSMLSCSTARLPPNFRGVTPLEVHNKEEMGVMANMEENCKGDGEDDECSLIRRTLAAHLDYIYTQDQEKQP